MRADLLLDLCDFLEKVPPERFDYRHWVGANWQGKEDLSCGTTACALGWATQVPSIKALGVRLSFNHYGPCVVDDLSVKEKDGSEGVAKRVFGLSSQEVDYLFFPGSTLYVPCIRDGISVTVRVMELGESPGVGARAVDVADHIRRFVAWKQKQ